MTMSTLNLKILLYSSFNFDCRKVPVFLPAQCQQLLLPQFLSAGIKVLSEASGNSASASVTFITTVTNATSKFSEGTQGFMNV